MREGGLAAGFFSIIADAKILGRDGKGSRREQLSDLSGTARPPWGEFYVCTAERSAGTSLNVPPSAPKTASLPGELCHRIEEPVHRPEAPEISHFVTVVSDRPVEIEPKMVYASSRNERTIGTRSVSASLRT